MVISDRDDPRRTQVEAAGRRYAASESKRQDVAQQRQRTDSLVVDTDEQLTARLDRLLASGQVPAHAVMAVGLADPRDQLATKERIIGVTNQLQAVNFLSHGARAAAAVGRISLSQNGREIPQGTGSLISPRLLLTNNHVLPDVETARDALIEFGAEASIDNIPLVPSRFRLDPSGFFVTDVHLDFTIVLVRPSDDGRTPADATGGWNPLIVQQGKIVVGESMNIVGHPMGRLKEISIRDNRLELQFDEFLHYITDTESGNSGSPVFNDQWEVVALHHSGVPRTDAQGRILRRDGNVWRAGDGDDAVDWVANEGVRVSVILKHLASLDLDAQQRSILAELGPTAALGAPAVISEGAAAPPPPQPVLERVSRRGIPARPTAFGGTRHLLFLHGRGQEGCDPELLRRTWTAGLNHGLTLAGLATIDPADVHFPFYGDVLLQPPAHESLTADPAGNEVYQQLVSEAAAQLGMPTALEAGEPDTAEGLPGLGSDLLSRLNQQLSWIAARSGLDDFLIARIFGDVAAYLHDAQTRRRVLDTVMETVPDSGRLVLVSHSLGTVVAMDLMSRLPAAVEVDLLVTAGSPLGLDAVYKRLESGGPHRPARIEFWLNTWYAGDPVAIGCPLSRSWAGQLQELAVLNPKDHPHDIAEYLQHPPVAGTISVRLLAP